MPPVPVGVMETHAMDMLSLYSLPTLNAFLVLFLVILFVLSCGSASRIFMVFFCCVSLSWDFLVNDSKQMRKNRE